jgi:chromosome segregation ATPase
VPLVVRLMMIVSGAQVPNEDDTELLLCLLAEVEEQIAESRACVHGASNKLEESKEFEAASAERQKEAQLSEATRRKLQRRSQIINAEVKSELAKAVAQLRHSSHHYRHVKGEIERALRQRDRRVMDYARSEGRAEALSDEVSQTKEFMRQLQKEKEDAEVRARRLQEEVDEQRKARALAETHAKTLSATLEQEEEALRREQEENQQAGHLGATLSQQLAETRALLEASEASNKQLTKSRDLLVAQLKNSKEVVARITADNLMFLNKIKHCETKLEQAIKEREVLRIDLNSADNRWFEHMRDELQKVTQSHLDAVDEYEARLQQVKEEAQSKTNKVTEQLGSTTEDLAAAKSSRDKYKEDLDSASQHLNNLRAEHDGLTLRHQQLTSDHTALTNSNSDLEQRFSDASLRMSQDADLINLLKVLSFQLLHLFWIPLRNPLLVFMSAKICSA